MQMGQAFAAIQLEGEGSADHLHTLLLVNVLFDNFQRHSSHRRNELRSGPQAWQAFFQPGELGPQHVSGIALDLSHDLDDADLQVRIKQDKR